MKLWIQKPRTVDMTANKPNHAVTESPCIIVSSMKPARHWLFYHHIFLLKKRLTQSLIAENTSRSHGSCFLSFIHL